MFTKTCSFLVLAVILLPLYSLAQLIGDPVDPNDFGLDESDDEFKFEIIRKRYVKLEEWNMGNQLSLLLFPDIEITSDLDFIERYGQTKSWKGNIQSDPSAYVIISEKNGVYFGKVVSPNLNTFLLVYKGASVYGIYEVDPSNIPQELDDQVLGEGDGTEMSGSICDSSYVCPGVTIDVLVVYTPAARSATGNDAAALEASIATAVTELNTVNTNSGVQHSYNLVHTEEVVFTESGSASADLAALRSTNDGLMDNIHQLRYAHRADLVALITSSAYCGIGYVQPSPSFFYSDIGFSISGFSCMATNLTFAHEIGHNMGLHHDWYVNSSSTPCSHHHGYVNQNAQASSTRRWRTVMAYNSNCSSVFGFNCRRVPYWSNPNNTMTGDPMGVPIGSSQASDNAFALNRASCMVAAFSETLTSFPVIYQDWQVSKEGRNIILDWSTAQEVNNQGFEIEARSDTSEAFQKLAFVAGRGNSNEVHRYAYQFKDAFPGRHYFRLKQIDLDGQYAYSSIKEVEINGSNKLYHHVFPNPSAGITQLQLSLSQESEYRIDLMDIDGQIIENLQAGELKAGSHRFTFNTQGLSPGLYFYSIRSLSERVMGKIWVQ